MARIQPIKYEESTGKAKDLLDTVKAKFGTTPNMMTTMAQSPAVLEAYLSFSGALGAGKLNPKLREQIALVSAEINGCDYCASAHTAIGQLVGLREEEILAARQGHAKESKADAALQFARTIVLNRGQVQDADLGAVRAAGLGEGEIAEIVANVALNIFTNYFNEIAQTAIDFPHVATRAAA